jgi:hypothetical protein
VARSAITGSPAPRCAVPAASGMDARQGRDRRPTDAGGPAGSMHSTTTRPDRRRAPHGDPGDARLKRPTQTHSTLAHARLPTAHRHATPRNPTRVIERALDMTSSNNGSLCRHVTASRVATLARAEHARQITNSQPEPCRPSRTLRRRRRLRPLTRSRAGVARAVRATCQTLRSSPGSQPRERLRP